MANSFAPLIPALKVLATEGRVLPATGQIMIDFALPSTEEAYDRTIGGDERVHILWETQRKLYHDLKPIPRREAHPFRYFVDGSTRTYFIGTVLEAASSSTVTAAPKRNFGTKVRRETKPSTHSSS